MSAGKCAAFILSESRSNRDESKGDNICILRSSAAQVSGSISYVIY